MRLPLKELLQKLAVEHEMVAYETFPWVHYDEERGITCSAEVRMGSDATALEVEVQFLYDDPEMARQDAETAQKQKAEREKEENKGQNNNLEEEDTESSDSGDVNVIQQKMFIRARLMAQEVWSPIYVSIIKEDFTNKIGDWEEKSCNFFRACVQAINMEEIPDIEELIKSEMDEGWGGRGGRRGKIGRKSPKVKPGALLGMKKPGG